MLNLLFHRLRQHRALPLWCNVIYNHPSGSQEMGICVWKLYVLNYILYLFVYRMRSYNIHAAEQKKVLLDAKKYIYTYTLHYECEHLDRSFIRNADVSAPNNRKTVKAPGASDSWCGRYTAAVKSPFQRCDGGSLCCFNKIKCSATARPFRRGPRG